MLTLGGARSLFALHAPIYWSATNTITMDVHINVCSGVLHNAQALTYYIYIQLKRTDDIHGTVQ